MDRQIDDKIIPGSPNLPTSEAVRQFGNDIIAGEFGPDIYLNTITNKDTPSGMGQHKIRVLPYVHYDVIQPDHDTTNYFKSLLKWICDTYPHEVGVTYIGRGHPNSAGDVIVSIYDTDDRVSGLPRYSSGIYSSLGGGLFLFGTSSGAYSFQDVTYSISSKLDKSGGVMTGSISYKGSQTTSPAITFIDNTADPYGNGIAIGGYGGVAVAAGECVSQFNTPNDEILHLWADGSIDFCSNGDTWSNKKTMTFDTNGSLSVPTNVYASSDLRLKDNIQDNTFDLLSILDKIKIKQFIWKTEENKNNQNIGVIAQELQKILPQELQKEFINQNSEGYYSVSDSKLVYLLIDAYQKEKQKRIELENRIKVIEDKLGV